MISDQRLGILVGGGHAPGINSALGAATIEAIKAGAQVTGIYDGFEHLIKGRTDMVRRLEYPDVSRIHFQGGSIIRTSRANPTRSEADLSRTVDTLKELGLTHLITIGGEDTASSAARICQRGETGIRIAHIPKTIDNDLPLPGNAPTFGFETARHFGTQWVLNLMEESRTTNRWCLVVVMGRKAGHLALGIGKAAGAIVTVIPEDFAAAQIARASGVDAGYDAHGNIRLEKIPLASIIEREMVRRFAERGESLPLVSVTLGYELRCAAPIPFDIDYTRTLGYGAVRFLLGQAGIEGTQSGGMVCLDNGRLRVMPFEELLRADTGRIRTRMVDTNSEHYMVAREYMIRLGRRDLEDPTSARKLSEAAGMQLDMFLRRFSPAVESDAAERPRVEQST